MIMSSQHKNPNISYADWVRFRSSKNRIQIWHASILWY